MSNTMRLGGAGCARRPSVLLFSHFFSVLLLLLMFPSGGLAATTNDAPVLSIQTYEVVLPEGVFAATNTLSGQSSSNAVPFATMSRSNVDDLMSNTLADVYFATSPDRVIVERHGGLGGLTANAIEYITWSTAAVKKTTP